MNKPIWIAIAATVSIFSIQGCKPTPRESKEQVPARQESGLRGSGAIDAVLETYSGGESIPLSRWQGKRTLLVFWAPWTDSASATVEWMDQFDSNGVELLPVVVDGKSPAERSTTKDLKAISRPVYLAGDGLLEAVGGVRAIPTAVLLDANGNVSGKWPGLPAFTGAVAAVQGPKPGSL